jgi:hypothetical protein
MYTLNIAKSLGCTSLLHPNALLLSDYSIAPAFAIQRQVTVECVRYDALFMEGKVPQPDVIKIDVQGFEYEVLNGFGGLLNGCLGVQLEAHLYPIYANQKLLGDLVSYLAEFGLVLRHLVPVEHFDGDVVEVDAWFTSGPAKTQRLSVVQQRKLELVLRAWNLPPHTAQFASTTWD